MDVLVLYLGIVVIGYFIGAFLRKKSIVLKRAGIIQTVAIIGLVFVMGSRIGAEKEIVKSLDTIGLTALIITLMAIAGSVGLAFIARKLLGFNKTGAFTKGKICESENKETGLAESKTINQAAVVESNIEDGTIEDVKTDNSMIYCILIPVIIGVLSGYLFLPKWFIDVSGTLIVVGLCILLLFVGLDLGTEGTIVENFRSAGWRIVVFPFLTITGTYLGAVITSVVLPLTAKDALCVASGFGWYTLAPAMLAEYSTEVSAIAFMHNVMRELIGILILPLVAKKIGHIESTGVVGAGAMDVCLPIIVRATSANMAVYAFITGVVLSIAVPVMVSFMMGL